MQSLQNVHITPLYPPSFLLSLAKANIRLQRRNGNHKCLHRCPWIMKFHCKRMPTLNSTKLYDMILCVTFTQLEVLHAGYFDMNTEMSTNAPSTIFHQGGRFWSSISSGLLMGRISPLMLSFSSKILIASQIWSSHIEHYRHHVTKDTLDLARDASKIIVWGQWNMINIP